MYDKLYRVGNVLLIFYALPILLHPADLIRKGTFSWGVSAEALTLVLLWVLWAFAHWLNPPENWETSLLRVEQKKMAVRIRLAEIAALKQELRLAEIAALKQELRLAGIAALKQEQDKRAGDDQ